jgi:hypothetical protein
MRGFARIAAVLLVLGLAGTPIGCMAMQCHVEDETHDCCPRKAVFAECPLDILASAKAAPQQQFTPVVAVVVVEFAEGGPVLEGVVAAAEDGQHLYLQHRVLRV